MVQLKFNLKIYLNIICIYIAFNHGEIYILLLDQKLHENKGLGRWAADALA
jgi:hypothetical protein